MTTTDESWLRKVIDAADLNVLRTTLYQLTGEESLRDVETERIPMRGGMFYLPAVAKEAEPALKEIALRLLKDLPTEEPAPPSREEARDLAQLLMEEKLSDVQFDFGYEEMGFDDFPRDVTWTSDRPAAADDFPVAIIGAGISGITAAIQMKRLGIPYVVFERQDRLGGTWNLNTYPEARVDTSIFLYQFTFEKNYPWSHHYATQAEVRQYLQHVAGKYGVTDSFRFGTEVTDATWDEESATWTLTMTHTDGATEQRVVKAIISATGLFSTPKVPDLPGADEYRGRFCHTARWDHSWDFTGAKVCLVGTGSTGSQISPHLAEQASHLTIIQRTPSWIGPVKGYKRSFTAEERWLFDHVPFYWNWYCYQAFAATEILQDGQVHDRAWQEKGGQISEANDKLRANLANYINTKLAGHPDLIDKCTPSYAPLGRRLVVDNGFYDTILRPDVDLVSAGVSHFVEDGLVTTEGQHIECEYVVLATGFSPSRYFAPTRYIGRDGATLEKLWAVDGPRSYLGMALPGFPNLFTIYGPNAAPRAGGSYSWSEVWSRYSAKAIVELIERGGRSIEVKREAFDAYNAEIDDVMTDLLWESEGIGSYQLNEFGRPSFSQPLRVDEYHSRLVTPNFDDYRFDA